MSITPLVVKPGVNQVETSLLNEGGWDDSNLIRFRDGLPEVRGGNTLMCATALSGTCRGMFAWDDLVGNIYLAAGTEQRLSIYTSGALYDITPLQATHNPTTPFTTSAATTQITVTDAASNASVLNWINIVNAVAFGGIVLQGLYQVNSVTNTGVYSISVPAPYPLPSQPAGGTAALFTTTNTSKTVTVTLTNHGFVANSVYYVNISTTVGGITLSGAYIVVSKVDNNNFTISSSAAATSSTSGSENGGNVCIQYLMNNGVAAPATGGYGIGNYGAGNYGQGGIGPQTPMQQWTFGQWGRDLIASPTNGSIYLWDPTSGTTGNPATLISAAPAYSTAIFVSGSLEQIVSLGSTVGGAQDPLLVAWCDAADYTDWTASALNQAGSFRLSRGNRIIGGLWGPQQGLIWTDIDLWLMQYIQPPLVYAFQEVGQGCGLVSARAWAVQGQVLYWLSNGNFCRYDGQSVQKIPCPLWDFVFGYLQASTVAGYQDSIFAVPNDDFNEITWYFPSTSSTNAGTVVPTAYVKMSTLDPRVWDKGFENRSAGIGRSGFGPPILCNDTGLLLQQETSYSDGLGNTPPAFIETGWIKIAGGEEKITVERFFPDFKQPTFNGTPTLVQIIIYFADYPNDTPVQYGPYTVTSTTQFVTVHGRGRLMKVRFQSAIPPSTVGTTAGPWWRLGQMRFLTKKTGKR